MKLTLKVWRQKNAEDHGQFVTYTADNISEDMSFLEMLDVVNESLLANHQIPIAFDHDCREGICGSCSLVINGIPHGKQKGVTTCQLHMRHFKDGETIVIEPWRVRPFKVLRDLIVERGAFDRIMQAGGYVSVNTGGAPDGNALPIAKSQAEKAFDAAQCIGCGACAAACKNGSAMLFVAAKVSHLRHLPQGQIEASERVKAMIKAHDDEGFGACGNQMECEAVCPKEISTHHISLLNREFLRASLQQE